MTKAVSELINPDIDRVDAVSGPATGIPFLMFKSAEGTPGEPEAEPVTKAEEEPLEGSDDDDAEDIAEAAASTDGPTSNGSPVTDEAAALAAPGSPEWEAMDAAKARVAAQGLAALKAVVCELAQREDTEEAYSSEAFDLMDASSALDFALGVLAKFAVTEQLEADTVQKAAGELRKALHLEVHDGSEAPADGGTPVAGGDAPAPEHAAPAAPAEHTVPQPTAKADAAPVPLGIMELLEELCAAVQHAKDNETQGAAAESPADTETPDQPAPVEPAKAPEPAPAPEAPAAPAEAAHPAAAPAPAADPAEDEDKKPNPFAKSAEDVFTERLQKALEAATEPLLKRIDTLERTPQNDGPLLSGALPGTVAGQPVFRGQEEGAPAEGLIQKSAGAQTPAIGAASLVTALKGLHAGR